MQLDPPQGLEHRFRLAGRHVERIVTGRVVATLESEHAQVALGEIVFRGVAILRVRRLGDRHAARWAVWGSRTVSRVRQGSSIPSLWQTTSAQTSAIPRSVVALPPVIVTNPSIPSVSAWSIVLNVRDSSRPVSVSRAPISGRAADHTE